MNDSVAVFGRNFGWRHAAGGICRIIQEGFRVRERALTALACSLFVCVVCGCGVWACAWHQGRRPPFVAGVTGARMGCPSKMVVAYLSCCGDHRPRRSPTPWANSTTSAKIAPMHTDFGRWIFSIPGKDMWKPNEAVGARARDTQFGHRLAASPSDTQPQLARKHGYPGPDTSDISRATTAFVQTFSGMFRDPVFPMALSR